MSRNQSNKGGARKVRSECLHQLQVVLVGVVAGLGLLSKRVTASSLLILPT